MCGPAGKTPQDCKLLSCRVAQARPDPASAGVLYHVHSSSLCLGWMHDSPWKSTESGFISENRRAVFNLCRSKGEPGGSPLTVKPLGQGKALKFWNIKRTTQNNRAMAWRGQGRKEHTHLCSMASSTSLVCSLSLDAANGSFPLTYSPVPQPHLCQPLHPQPGAH